MANLWQLFILCLLSRLSCCRGEDGSSTATNSTAAEAWRPLDVDAILHKDVPCELYQIELKGLVLSEFVFSSPSTDDHLPNDELKPSSAEWITCRDSCIRHTSCLHWSVQKQADGAQSRCLLLGDVHRARRNVRSVAGPRNCPDFQGIKTAMKDWTEWKLDHQVLAESRIMNVRCAVKDAWLLAVIWLSLPQQCPLV
eukprot:GHVT01088624.1.p1 GENE.GHVT01088624.1~~GHVT01088624.1.p1  ORF type:complete len:197 (+),score=7.17 GHVT01088624.1:541-1131(+)